MAFEVEEFFWGDDVTFLGGVRLLYIGTNKIVQ